MGISVAINCKSNDYHRFLSCLSSLDDCKNSLDHVILLMSPSDSNYEAIFDIAEVRSFDLIKLQNIYDSNYLIPLIRYSGDNDIILIVEDTVVANDEDLFIKIEKAHKDGFGIVQVCDDADKGISFDFSQYPTNRKHVSLNLLS